VNLGKKELVFNAQKFCVDNAGDLAMYHKVMRKYAGDNVLCSERYFNKNAELFIYVEWLGEEDFVEEFCNNSNSATLPTTSAPAASVKKIASKILHAANAKEENAGRPD
jgi:hypothetical protein